jgi:hypothetical protein
MQMDKVLELQAVLLRNHPQMSYKGVPSWPPRWIWLEGPEDKHPKGEVGILRTVLLSKDRVNRCFLLIFHEESSYMGCLLFDDFRLCRQAALATPSDACWHGRFSSDASRELAAQDDS